MGLVERPIEIDNWAYKARNNVLFNVDEVPLTMSEYIERVKQNEKIVNKEATRFPHEVLKQPTQVGPFIHSLFVSINAFYR